MTPADRASFEHLLGRLHAIELRLAEAVRARGQPGSPEDDRFRGLYITNDDAARLLTTRIVPRRATPLADRVLARTEELADGAEISGADLRIRRLARSFRLDEVDVDVLLIALAPDLDPRFERLYAYVHDDVTKRRATTGLALELCGATPTDARARGRLGDGGALVASGLLAIEERDRPFLTRDLRVPDRVAAHLLGDDAPDPPLADVVVEEPEVRSAEAGPLVRALRSGGGPVYVRERSGAAGRSFAAAGVIAAGLVPIVLDLRRVGATARIEDLVFVARREARLRSAALVVDPIETLADLGAEWVRSVAEAACPVVLVGAAGWDPEWSGDPPFVIEAPLPSPALRLGWWRHALDGDRAAVPLDPSATPVPFRLSPGQVVRAATVARRRAAAADRTLAASDLVAGAKAQNAAGLERLARRVEPAAGWDDLVLAPDTLSHLRELSSRVRHRAQVLDGWSMRRASRARGTTALFAGESGTGKTISAEVLANDIGFDLYAIDLSTVVDKYVGETEKNLDRIFAAADRVDGVLLFDEADALFGKRSEVRESKDRWANIEVGYLLQRIERFDGVAILTTNLRSNVDEAFLRRLDVAIDFAAPDEPLRRHLWTSFLGRGVPTSDDVDVGFLAASFRVNGGHIRNVVVTAAYLAAAEGGPVDMARLIRAIRREYQKLGRLCVEAEFGRYLPLVAGEADPAARSGDRRFPVGRSE